MLKGSRFLASRKAVAVWISWVLLVGIGVVLGAFVLNWSRERVTVQGQDIQQRAEYASMCQNMGLRLEALCQNTQTLNMNVSNNNNIKVDSIVVRMVDIYGSPQLREINMTIKPSEAKGIKLVKQGVLQRAEILPAGFSGTRRITCQNKAIVAETIPQC